MLTVKAGCVLERLPPLTARKAIKYFEYAPREPLPKFATLARFRKQWGEGVQVALVVPKHLFVTPKGPFREGPELDAGLDWVKRVTDILGAFAIVVAPGNLLSPGGRDRELLRSYVQRLALTKRQIVVAPRGLWEAETAAEFAEEVGALYGFDPLEDDAPGGALAYARVKPMGARPRLTDGHLLQILQRGRAGGATELLVSIESEDAYRSMKRLQNLAAELPEEDFEQEEDAFAALDAAQADDDADEELDEDDADEDSTEDTDEELDDEELDDEDDGDEELDDEDDGDAEDTDEDLGDDEELDDDAEDEDREEEA
jgi:hypothetical protein